MRAEAIGVLPAADNGPHYNEPVVNCQRPKPPQQTGVLYKDSYKLSVADGISARADGGLLALVRTL